MAGVEGRLTTWARVGWASRAAATLAVRSTDASAFSARISGATPPEISSWTTRESAGLWIRSVQRGQSKAYEEPVPPRAIRSCTFSAVRSISPQLGHVVLMITISEPPLTFSLCAGGVIAATIIDSRDQQLSQMDPGKFA